jgi:hypothetical protein
VPRISAAVVPKGIASSTAMKLAMMATCSDSSSRIAISSVTGRSVHIERPRSSVARPTIQSLNW